MNNPSVLIAAVAFLLAGSPASSAEKVPPGRLAGQILEASGIAGGVVVHLGCGDGKLTAALLAGDGYLVHGLDTDANNVLRAREHIHALRLYGRVSIDRLVGNRLPYADNLVNLVVSEDPGKIPMGEVLRVLCPRGVARVKRGGRWVNVVKPWPKEIDEWTHYLHGPDNNAVARDTVVGPPRHLQWIQQPVFDRHHDTLAGFRAVVSASGRIFSIEDEGPVELPYWPGEWFVKARDAFNGLMLWKRPIAAWEPVSRPHRTGPVQQPRRLVAAGDRVFVTLGLDAPVAALDAATGETVKTYPGTESTQEILFSDGVLFLVVGDPTVPTGRDYLFERSKRYGHDLQSDPTYVTEATCSIMAVDARSGKRLWEKSAADTKGYWAMSLAVRGDRVAFLNQDSLLCLDGKTGRQLWRAGVTAQIAPPGTPPVVVIGEQAIYAADGKKLIAFALDDGRTLWQTGSKIGHPVSGPNVYLAQGAVWLDTKGGFDPRTGELQRSIGTPYAAGMSHHRCYRDKATVRYMITGRNGTEFLPFGTEEDVSHHWVRGTCQYGIVPCNGLLYATPDNCECNATVKVNGYLALAPERKGGSRAGISTDAADSRLERGPAYATGIDPASTSSLPSSDDWPTLRHDPARSGKAGCAVGPTVGKTWEVTLGGKLSQPVVAGGRIFVAAVDRHTVHALDRADGKRLWRYTAGGRVDSPPTVYKDMVLFGSTDGWIYCLRASDGVLAWRFRAAPRQRIVGAWEQLESAWPVHGSVLVQRGLLYAAAGRSSFVDGGIHLWGLQPETGEIVHETVLRGPWDEVGHQIVFNRKDVKGWLSDVLQSDGEFLYMRSTAFDLKCVQQENVPRPHLFATAGLLNDDWNHRTFWTVDTVLRYGGGGGGPDGELMVVDGTTVYAVRGYPVGRHSTFDPRRDGYTLLASKLDGKQKAAVPGGRKPRNRKNKRAQPLPSAADSLSNSGDGWSVNIPVCAKAMVLSGKTLFLAGTPNVYDAHDPSGAVEGRKGGLLWAVSAEDGAKLAEYNLDAPPVFDGLIAAAGRLYLSTKDGRLACWTGNR